MRDDDDARLFLAHRLIARDAETERVANSIHGDAMQVVSAVALGLGVLRESLAGAADDDALEQLAYAERAVADALARLKALTASLRTHAAADGVSPGLRLRLELLRAQAGVRYTLDDRLGDEPSGAVAEALARPVAEVVENVRRHARATHVHAELARVDGGVMCRIRDDGVGLPDADSERVAANRMGLTLMRERIQSAGGRMTVESAPGAGVSVELWVPDGG